MLLDIILEDGTTLIGWSRADAESMNIPEAAIAAAEARSQEATEKASVRATIEEKAGDSASLLGTAQDATHLLVVHLARLSAKLSTATTIAEVRAAAQPFAALTADFLAKIEGGEVRMPFLEKGEDVVLTDIETRATAVAEALATQP